MAPRAVFEFKLAQVPDCSAVVSGSFQYTVLAPPLAHPTVTTMKVAFEPRFTVFDGEYVPVSCVMLF